MVEPTASLKFRKSERKFFHFSNISFSNIGGSSLEIELGLGPVWVFLGYFLSLGFSEFAHRNPEKTSPGRKLSVFFWAKTCYFWGFLGFTQKNQETKTQFEKRKTQNPDPEFEFPRTLVLKCRLSDNYIKVMASLWIKNLVVLSIGLLVT